MITFYTEILISGVFTLIKLHLFIGVGAGLIWVINALVQIKRKGVKKRVRGDHNFLYKQSYNIEHSDLYILFMIFLAFILLGSFIIWDLKGYKNIVKNCLDFFRDNLKEQ